MDRPPYNDWTRSPRAAAKAPATAATWIASSRVRDQHQGLNRSMRRIAAFHERYGERQRLSRPGAGLAHHVPAREEKGNGLLLDGRWLGDAHAGNHGEDYGPEPHSLERGGPVVGSRLRFFDRARRLAVAGTAAHWQWAAVVLETGAAVDWPIRCWAEGNGRQRVARGTHDLVAATAVVGDEWSSGAARGPSSENAKTYEMDSLSQRKGHTGDSARGWRCRDDRTAACGENLGATIKRVGAL